MNTMGSMYSNSPVGYSLESTLDILAGDVLIATVLASANPSFSVDSFSISAQLNCTWDEEDGDLPPWMAPACSDSLPLVYTPFTADYTNNTILFFDSPPYPLNESIVNYMQVLWGAFLVDIGVWDDSIFTSSSRFNASITPNDVVTSALQQDPTLNSLSFSPLNGSGALQLREFQSSLVSGWYGPSYGSPSLIPADQCCPPAAIATTYICQEQRLKSTLNLVVCTLLFLSPSHTGNAKRMPPPAVIIGDSSMFATFWAGYTVVASMLAKRRGERRRFP